MNIVNIFIYKIVLYQLTYVFGMQYGCYDGETCNLSSEVSNFMVQDVLYCTSSVISCNIYCDSPNSCRDLIIYSSAQSTNILCHGNFSCFNTSIRIGDTSIYPLNFKRKHFSNIHPIKSTINCQASQSCSSLKMYFHGTENDEITIYVSNINAFYDGYFDCNLNINNNNNNNSTNGCNLYCPNIYANECLEATLDCNFADDTYCKCDGDGCNMQSVNIFYDISTTIINVSHIEESFFASEIFKYIIIICVILAICLGCCLILCCWKFETIYNYFEGKTAPQPLKVKHLPAQSHSEYNQSTQNISKQNSQTVSRSQSGGNTNNITDETETNTNKNNEARERMPSSWYKYKQQKHCINNNTVMNQSENQQPIVIKHNRNRKKSDKINKMREYKKVKVKEQISKYEAKNNESKSDPLSTSNESESESDTDSTSTDSDTDSDTNSSSTSKDGDNAEETKQTVNGVNIDDMMVNMVMLIQKTPVDPTPNDKNNNNASIQFPNTFKVNSKTNV